MPEILEFNVLHEYSLFKVGITVEAILNKNSLRVDVEAKIDNRFDLLAFLNGITAKVWI